MALTCKLSQEAQQTGWLSFYVLIIFWSLDLPSNELNYWVFHAMFLDVTAYIWKLKKKHKINYSAIFPTILRLRGMEWDLASKEK